MMFNKAERARREALDMMATNSARTTGDSAMIRNCEDCRTVLPCLPYKGTRAGKTWWLCDNCTSFPRTLASDLSRRNVAAMLVLAVIMWGLAAYVYFA